MNRKDRRSMNPYDSITCTGSMGMISPPGAFTMKAPNCGTTSRLCVRRNSAIKTFTSVVITSRRFYPSKLQHFSVICRKRLQKSRYCTESLRISKIISYFAPRISRKSNRATSPDFDRCSSDRFSETNRTKHEKQVQRPDRTDVRFPAG